jgi:hypothetical protein
MSKDSLKLMNATVNNIDPAQSRLHTLMSFLESYDHAMRPGAMITSTDGAGWQRRLYQTLMRTLKADSNEFIQQYQAILQYVHTHPDGAFRNPLPFRFPEHVALSPEELLNFQRLLQLILLTANPMTRLNNLRQTHLPATLSKFQGAIADKITAFYSL